MVVAPMDLGQVMEDAIDRFGLELEARSIRRSVSRDGDLSCSGDKEKILEVFVAVLQNAIDSMLSALPELGDTGLEKLFLERLSASIQTE